MAHAADYAAFSVFTGASLAVGLYFSLKKAVVYVSVTDEMFLGSNSLHVLPLGLSILASVTSATGAIGIPAHAYTYGFHIGWTVALNLILIPLAVRVVVPVLYSLKITSVFQYVRMRYNAVVSIMASVTYILFSQMVGAIAIYASSVAVSTIFHVPSSWCSIAFGFVATAYTAMGGLRGVVWADCLQGLLTLTVPILVMCKVAYDASIGRVRTRPLGELDLRKYFLNVTMDFATNETVWGMLVASSPTFINRICLDQMAVQRYLASKTLQQAKATMVLGTVMTCVFYMLGIGEGVALSCRYGGCDPEMLGNIERTDQILPYYVLNDLSSVAGLSGIFLAGIVSASISTVSSTVNSQATVVYMDIVTPFFKVASGRASCIIKAIAFATGSIMTGLSLAIPYLGSALSIMFVATAAISGPLVGLLLLGLTAPFATSKGAGAATVVMVAYQLVYTVHKLQSGVREQRMPTSINYCADYTNMSLDSFNDTISPSTASLDETFPPFRFSAHWSSFFSVIATYFGGLVASILLGGSQPPTDVRRQLTSDFLVPVWRRLGLLSAERKATGCQGTVPKQRDEMSGASEQLKLTEEDAV